VLGPPGSPEADFRALVWRRRLPVAFPKPVLEQVARLEAGLRPEHLAGRLDLRDRPFLTIDPANARDHDDAVCVEALPAGASRLWVAIADVAHYVAPGSPLDREALRRGNSVYFPDRAIPMLPEALSGELCSLRAGVDRLVLVAELSVEPSGDASLRRLASGVIRSRARLVYDDAARVMEGGPPAPTQTGEVVEQLHGLRRVAEALLARGAPRARSTSTCRAPKSYLAMRRSRSTSSRRRAAWHTAPSKRRCSRRTGPWPKRSTRRVFPRSTGITRRRPRKISKRCGSCWKGSG
jgi:ribonuclease R